MSGLQNLRMVDLYSALGYEKGTSKWKALDVELHAFFLDYISRGHVISKRGNNLIEATLCASDFLAGDDRGDRFWSVSSEAGTNLHNPAVAQTSGLSEPTGQGLSWPVDEQIIVPTMAHILRRKQISLSICESQKRSNDAPRNENEPQKRRKVSGAKEKRPSKRKLLSDDEDVVDDTSDLEASENDSAPRVLYSHYSLATWEAPSKRPSRSDYINYISSLNPRFDLDGLKEFTKEWLSRKSAIWPESADPRLQFYMHEKKLFILFDDGLDSVPSVLMARLRRGTDLQFMDGQQISIFQMRIRQRVKHLTEILAFKDHFLELQKDGTPKQSERFKQHWDNRETIFRKDFQLAIRPAKRPRKSKQLTTGNPIDFTPVQEREHQTQPMLASVADKALEYGRYQHEEDTTHISSLDGYQDVSTDTAPENKPVSRSPSYNPLSRGFSSVDSIEVDVPICRGGSLTDTMISRNASTASSTGRLEIPESPASSTPESTRDRQSQSANCGRHTSESRDNDASMSTSILGNGIPSLNISLGDPVTMPKFLLDSETSANNSRLPHTGNATATGNLQRPNVDLRIELDISRPNSSPPYLSDAQQQHDTLESARPVTGDESSIQGNEQSPSYSSSTVTEGHSVAPTASESADEGAHVNYAARNHIAKRTSNLREEPTFCPPLPHSQVSFREPLVPDKTLISGDQKLQPTSKYYNTPQSPISSPSSDNRAGTHSEDLDHLAAADILESRLDGGVFADRPTHYQQSPSISTDGKTKDSLPPSQPTPQKPNSSRNGIPKIAESCDGTAPKLGSNDGPLVLKDKEGLHQRTKSAGPILEVTLGNLHVLQSHKSSTEDKQIREEEQPQNDTRSSSLPALTHSPGVIKKALSLEKGNKAMTTPSPIPSLANLRGETLHEIVQVPAPPSRDPYGSAPIWYREVGGNVREPGPTLHQSRLPVGPREFPTMQSAGIFNSQNTSLPETPPQPEQLQFNKLNNVPFDVPPPRVSLPASPSTCGPCEPTIQLDEAFHEHPRPASSITRGRGRGRGGRGRGSRGGRALKRGSQNPMTPVHDQTGRVTGPMHHPPVVQQDQSFTTNDPRQPSLNSGAMPPPPRRLPTLATSPQQDYDLRRPPVFIQRPQNSNQMQLPPVYSPSADYQQQPTTGPMPPPHVHAYPGGANHSMQGSRNEMTSHAYALPLYQRQYSQQGFALPNTSPPYQEPASQRQHGTPQQDFAMDATPNLSYTGVDRSPLHPTDPPSYHLGPLQTQLSWSTDPALAATRDNAGRNPEIFDSKRNKTSNPLSLSKYPPAASDHLNQKFQHEQNQSMAPQPMTSHPTPQMSHQVRNFVSPRIFPGRAAMNISAAAPLAQNPVTPSPTPSHVRVCQSGRHDGTSALVPDTTPYSMPLQRGEGTELESNPKPAPFVQPSSDWRLPRSSAPTRTLEFVIEKSDGNIDLDHSFSVEIIEKSTLAEFFDFFTAASGIPLIDLSALTFTPDFGNRQDFVVHRRKDADPEKPWKKFQERLHGYYEMWRKRTPDKMDFEVWVQVGDLRKKTGG